MYKIGLSKNIDRRLSSLKTGNTNLKLINHLPTQNMYSTEKLFHLYLKPYKEGGEWFNLSPDLLEVVIQTFDDINNYYRLWQRAQQQKCKSGKEQTQEGCPHKLK